MSPRRREVAAWSVFGLIAAVTLLGGMANYRPFGSMTFAIIQAVLGLVVWVLAVGPSKR